MGKINMGRVMLGGLLAGLIINAGEFLLNDPILGKDWAEVMKSIGKDPVGGLSVAIFVIFGFVLGILMVWLYAAIRPRFGAGAKTALCAGLVVWALAYLHGAAGQMAIGIFPTRLLVIGTIWGLVELVIASVAGAWLYKES